MRDEGISAIPVESRPYQGQRAGLITRAIACTIDGAVVVLVLVAGYIGLCGVIFLLNPRSFSFPNTSLLRSMTAAFIVCVVYFTLAWSITGRTYGDHVMGLRVVGSRRDRLHPIASVLRALACTAFPIGLLWIAWSPTNRSLQDTLLRTSVIYDWHPTAPWSRRQAVAKLDPHA